MERQHQHRNIEAAMIVLTLFVVASVFTFVFPKTLSLTGYATVSSPLDVANTLEQTINSFPLLSQAGDGANICLSIVSEGTTYAFDLSKQGDEVSIQSVQNPLCDGDYNEDIIIKYTSYDAFMEDMQQPSCETFRSGSDGSSFYILPSKFISEGMQITCNELFASRYCPLIQSCASTSEIEQAGLTCCLDSKDLKNEKPGFLSFSNIPKQSFLWVILGGIALIIIFGGIGIYIMGTKKENDPTPELLSYLKRASSMGYSEMQLRQTLIGHGWDEELVDKAIMQLRQTNTQLSQPYSSYGMQPPRMY